MNANYSCKYHLDFERRLSRMEVLQWIITGGVTITAGKTVLTFISLILA